MSVAAQEPGIYRKRLEIAAVDTDDWCLKSKRGFQLDGVMGFYESVHPQLLYQVVERSEPRLIEQARDQEDRVGAPGACLIHLIRLKDKVLTEYRYADSRPYRGKVV